MTNRRETLTGALALLCQAAASGQAQSQTPPGQVFKHELPKVNMEDWEVTVSHVDYAPGRVGPPHRHAGFVLAYVLEGTVIAKVTGQPETTYTAGQMFYEPPGSTHEVSKNASATVPAKLLAMIFAPKGATLTVPA
jgi:quercetin dioxygenase-like cupin family protein